METNESKAIFKNTYIPNEASAEQTYRSISFVRRLLVFLLGIGFLGMALYYLIRVIRWAEYYKEPVYTQSLFWLSIAVIVLYVFLIVRDILAPRAFAKRETRRLKEAYGTSEITIEISFFAESVDFHNCASNADLRLSYAALHRFTETRDLFLIRTQQKQLIVLDKYGFDGTDIKGFRTFIDEKCPNAKRRWKKED